MFTRPPLCPGPSSQFSLWLLEGSKGVPGQGAKEERRLREVLKQTKGDAGLLASQVGAEACCHATKVDSILWWPAVGAGTSPWATSPGSFEQRNYEEFGPCFPWARWASSPLGPPWVLWGGCWLELGWLVSLSFVSLGSESWLYPPMARGGPTKPPTTTT